jgi:hypothetical protein
LVLLAMGMASLVAAAWGGLARMSLALPLPADNANWVTFHGPLMVCGFLGTVIALERAVGLPDTWAYLAPVLTGLGATVLLAGHLGRTAPLLITAGSVGFAAVTWRVVQLQTALFTVTMSVGAVAWLVGNVLWVLGWPFDRLVPFWMTFLGLIIAGERLDLGRFQKQVPAARPLFFLAVGTFLAGVVLGARLQNPGQRATGAGLLLLALWLGRFDIARRTVKQPGLPRFMAVCLLGGYVWLGIAGLLLLAATPLQAGTTYDAALHAFFVGFVFGMIFGHGPVIFPAVLHVSAVPFRRRFYVPLVVLHLSLALRLSGDLGQWVTVRQWGGILNGVAILLFLINTVVSLVLRPYPRSEMAKPALDKVQD